jgi:uncharacterized protein (DUF433 family)
MTGVPKIVTDPRIMMGKPVIEGTRITVELILTRLAEGRSIADIVREYPHLGSDQVAAAIEYARSKVSNPAEAAE